MFVKIDDLVALNKKSITLVNLGDIGWQWVDEDGYLLEIPYYNFVYAEEEKPLHCLGQNS